MRTIARSLMLAGSVVFSTAAIAQEFPTKPVTLIINFSPGGANDLLGRYLADNLSKLWKQPVTVENRAGAGGSIGTAAVARSKPDGYTLLFTSGSFTINSAVQKSLPFDPVKDIQPIAKIGTGEMIVVTGNRIPLPNLAELAKQAKAQRVMFGANGASLTTFGGALFAAAAGVTMVPVAYKGGTEALLDLAGGRIDAYFGTVPTVLSSVQGKLATPIAVMSKQRSKTFPDVPTIVEAGYPDAVVEQWWAVFAPGGMPADLVKKLNDDIKTVLNTPAADEFFGKNGATVGVTSAEELSKLIATEMPRWSALAKEYNISE